MISSPLREFPERFAVELVSPASLQNLPIAKIADIRDASPSTTRSSGPGGTVTPEIACHRGCR